MPNKEKIEEIKKSVSISLSVLIKHDLVKIKFNESEWSYMYYFDKN